MKNKIIPLFFLLLAIVQWGQAQPMIHSFEEVDSLQQIKARSIVVFIGTDWCRYCKKMEYTTFQAPKVMALLEEHYYFVKLDAEDQRSIRFNGYSFQFKPTGTNIGIHELAEALATVKGKVAYPSLCILNEQYDIVFQYQQYISAREMEAILENTLIEKTR